MRLKSVSKMFSLLAFTTFIFPITSAQDTGWYIGGNIGQSKAKIDDTRITNSLLSGGLVVTSLQADNRDMGYKAFLGYQFGRYFSLEGGYFDLGKFKYEADTTPLGMLTGSIKVKGLDFDLVGTLPLTERFSAFGRIGVTYAEAKDAFSGTGAVAVVEPDLSKRGTNHKFGGGLQFDFSKAFGLRAEAERYRIDDGVGNKGDIDLYSLGVVFRFGRKTAAPPPVERVAASPAPVETVVQAPVLVIVPAPERTQEYCTILDLQFEIDRDEIEREDKEKLAVVGRFLSKYPDTKAVIEGHSDDVGTSEHNMKLSQRRAESVVGYLVTHFHIAPSRLQAVGYGDSRPIGDNRTEDGKRQNRRIGAVIACAKDIEGLTVAPARITMAMLIEFDKNQAEIRPQYRDDLHKMAKFLAANPAVTATVEGHAGNTTPELSQQISQRRAQNVVDYLVDNFGIDRTRLSAEGYGKSRRFAYNTNEEGQRENRRVNIIINYPK